ALTVDIFRLFINNSFQFRYFPSWRLVRVTIEEWWGDGDIYPTMLYTCCPQARAGGCSSSA
ncbi:MAG: hypothetical protein KC643_31060, partial [Nitrospira sp.]|nr:hypothetical protein [Nitrospira sp.]